MPIKKYKPLSPDPYVGKTKGDTEFARLAHLNNLVDQINESGGAGGGIQSVVGGAGSTIDNTDPLNPIVNVDGARPKTSITASTSTDFSDWSFSNPGNIYTFDNYIGAPTTFAFDAPSIDSGIEISSVLTITNNLPFSIIGLSSFYSEGYLENGSYNNVVIAPGETQDFIWNGDLGYFVRIDSKTNYYQFSLDPGNYYLSTPGVYAITAGHTDANYIYLPDASFSDRYGFKYTVINRTSYSTGLRCVSNSDNNVYFPEDMIAEYMQQYSIIEIINVGGRWTVGYYTNNHYLPTSSAVLSAVQVQGITSSTATIGASVVSSGNLPVLERGFVYGNNPDPTVDDIKIPIYPNYTGYMTSLLEFLSANTTYYVRAFCTNELGTAYGPNQSFVTLP